MRRRCRSLQLDVESRTRVVIFHDRFEDPLNQHEIIGCQRLTPQDALVGLRELHQVFGPATVRRHFAPRLWFQIPGSRQRRWPDAGMVEAAGIEVGV